MKKFRILGLIMVFVMALSSITFGQEVDKVISVNGKGSIMVSPDLFMVDLGIESEAKTAREVQKINSELSKNLKAKLLSLGVDEKNIKTVNYNLYKDMEYDPETRTQIMKGYKLVNTVNVVVEDLEKLSKIIDESTDIGVNNIYNIKFTVKDKEVYYNQALKKAIENGKGKASAMAQAAGVSISSPSKVVEVGNYYEPVMYRANYMAEAAADGGSDISSGQLEISANVQLEYNY